MSTDKITCPKCHSEHIHADKKGFSTGKAIAGTLIGGVVVGAFSGAIGNNKIQLTCLNCGNKFFPGEGTKITVEDLESEKNKADIQVQYVKQEVKTYKCHNCQKISTIETLNKTCPKCGHRFKDEDANFEREKAKSGCFGTLFMLITVCLFTLVILCISTCPK